MGKQAGHNIIKLYYICNVYSNDSRAPLCCPIISFLGWGSEQNLVGGPAASVQLGSSSDREL